MEGSFLVKYACCVVDKRLARILRTYLHKIPILAVGLMLYDENNKPKAIPSVVQVIIRYWDFQLIQWLDDQNLAKLADKRVLVVDEVDDSRTTLQ